MTKKSVPKMFMRFYGQPIEKIAQCMAVIKELGIPPFTYTVEEGHLSCNPMLPPGVTLLQAWLHFNSQAELEQVSKSPEVQYVYQQFASSPEVGPITFEYRRRGQVAFEV